MISGFRHDAHEICALLGFYANVALQFHTKVLGQPISPIFKGQESSWTAWFFKMGPKYRYGITILRCIKSQNTSDFICRCLDSGTRGSRIVTLLLPQLRSCYTVLILLLLFLFLFIYLFIYLLKTWCNVECGLNMAMNVKQMSIWKKTLLLSLDLLLSNLDGRIKTTTSLGW